MDVTVTSTSDGWVATLRDYPGIEVQARALVNLDRFIRDELVAGGAFSETAAQACEFDWIFETGNAAIDAEAAALRVERNRLNVIAADLASRTDVLAQQLVSSGFSVRDTARLTGVSPQRVSQLTRRADDADDAEE